MKKWIPRIIFGVIIALIILLGLFFFVGKEKSKDENSDIIVKDNVKVISSKMNEDELPVQVADDRVVFKKKPKYKKGDVIVCGSIEKAENGFIRKIVDISELNDRYIYYTEPAFLTDVFEKVNIVKRVKLTEDGAIDADLETLALETAADDINKFQNLTFKSDTTYSLENLSSSNDENSQKNEENKKEADASGKKVEDNGTDYMFGGVIQKEEDPFYISGEAGVSIWVEFNLKIIDGGLIFGMSLKNESGAELSCSISKSVEKEIEKTLFSKELKPFEFWVGEIPIVITNEIKMVLKAEAELEGGIGASYEITYDGTLGFEYNSSTNEVTKIDDPHFDTTGLEWTAVEASGEASAGGELHLTSKLYDVTGIDISAGIKGSVEGKVRAAPHIKPDGFAGELDLSIGPEVEGKLVVDIPVVDDKLVEQELFKVSILKPWEKHWQSENGEADLEKTESGDNGKTYTTKFGEEKMITCPTFQFSIPNGWQVKSEEIGDGTDIVQEKVVLSNDENLEVTYWDIPYDLGGHGKSVSKAEITKVEDSDFEPGYPDGTNTDYSYLGNFIVAKVHITATMMGGIDNDWVPADGTFYAVVPESYVGEIEFGGVSGMLEAVSFKYPQAYAFIAESPDGTFTAKQEKEVVKILKSFKVTQSIY